MLDVVARVTLNREEYINLNILFYTIMTMRLHGFIIMVIYRLYLSVYA